MEKKYLYRGFCALILIILASTLFCFAWWGFVSENNNTGRLLGIGNIAMAVFIYVGIFTMIGKWMGAYRIGIDRKAAIMASIVLTIFSTNFLEIFISMAITNQFRYFSLFLLRYFILGVIQMGVLCVLVIPMVNIYRKQFPALKLFEIYGDNEQGLKMKMNAIGYKYKVVDSADYRETTIMDLKKRIEQVDAVAISDIPSHEKNKILKLCVDMDKRVYYIPKIGDVIVRYSDVLNLIDTPLFLVRKVRISIVEKALKRFFDIVLSIIALIIAFPVLLATSIAIKIEDGGPIFYRQERVTIGGNRFMILKFRSMIVDAEKDGKPHPAGEQDPRITKVGNIIRSCRIDEIPQIWNILKGDMSIVGPRPERLEHVEKYTNDIPEFTFRSKVKGGLTGYAQVYGKYNTTALDKLKMDLMYIMNFSLLLDLQIMFETVKILIRRESTEGFDEKRVDEMHEWK